MKIAKISEENLKVISSIKKVLGFASVNAVVSDMLKIYMAQLKKKSEEKSK